MLYQVIVKNQNGHTVHNKIFTSKRKAEMFENTILASYGLNVYTSSKELESNANNGAYDFADFVNPEV